MSNVYTSIFSEGINFHEGIEYKTVAVMADRIFHTESTKKRFWDVMQWQTPGRPQPRYPGAAHVETPFAQSFGLHATIVMYGALDSVPKEDIDDDLYGVMHQLIPAMGGGFARAFRTNEEQVCAELFANSGYTSGTGLNTFDGVALFSTAHPTSQLLSGTTISNRPSSDTDISISSADACRTALVTQYAANGNEILYNAPRIFVAHPSQARVARQVWEADWERNQANLNENIMPRYNVEVLEWPYFQKSGATGTYNAWFVIGETHHLWKVTRERFNADSDYDVRTRSVIVVADHRFLVTWTDFRGAFGSVGS